MIYGDRGVLVRKLCITGCDPVGGGFDSPRSPQQQLGDEEMPKDWKVTKMANGTTKRSRTTGANKIGGRKSGRPAHVMSTEDLQRYAKGEAGKNKARAVEELSRRGVGVETI